MLSKTHSKYIQSLHGKKFRTAESLFLAEGTKVVTELIVAGNYVCRELIATQEWLADQRNWLQQHPGFIILEAAPHEIEKITTLSTPSPVVGVFEQGKNEPVDPRGKLSLMLDDIQDPGNLGTIIRIADWFGIGAIICSDTCTELYNPKVVQSSMGSLGRIPVYYTHLERMVQHNSGFPVYAAVLDGISVKELGIVKEGFIVIGNESRGISPELLAIATQRITIPRRGEAESLNAAVATGIILSYLV